MRDRLVELLCNVKCEGEECFGNCPHRIGQKCNKVQRLEMCSVFAIADHLLAEGVIVPPVKVGQTVYSKKCNAYIVEGIHYKNGSFLFGGNRENKEGTPQSVWLESDIGKTVFLTREEAEKALAERRDK